jgi:hypothetical protein
MRLREKGKNLGDVSVKVGGDAVDDLQRRVLLAALDLADAAPADTEIPGHPVLADPETGPEFINVVSINQIPHSTPSSVIQTAGSAGRKDNPIRQGKVPCVLNIPNICSIFKRKMRIVMFSSGRIFRGRAKQKIILTNYI